MTYMGYSEYNAHQRAKLKRQRRSELFSWCFGIAVAAALVYVALGQP